jgi:hypothetical protein
MPNINKNTAYVEQETASKVLVLYAGDITPTVMSNFEEACIAFFKTKVMQASSKSLITIGVMLPAYNTSRQCCIDWQQAVFC